MGKMCAGHPDRNATGFCVKCGKAMCAECAQKLSGRNFCTPCLTADMKKAQEAEKPVKMTQRPDAEMLPITPPRQKRRRGNTSLSMKEFRRVVAAAIDFILLIVVSVPLSWFLMQLTILAFREVNGIGYNLSFYMVFTVLSSLYFTILHWRYGRTAGKLLMGLRVVGYVMDDRITFAQSFWRWIGFMASAIWAFMGYWIAAHALGWMAIFKDKIPQWMLSLGVGAGIVLTGLFSLGLLITFVGKYNRGFHDLLGSTIVRLEPWKERRLKVGDKN